jgi:hypothetical protein
VCGDVLERVRQRLFGVIEQTHVATSTATARVDASFSAASGMAKEGV